MEANLSCIFPLLDFFLSFSMRCAQRVPVTCMLQLEAWIITFASWLIKDINPLQHQKCNTIVSPVYTSICFSYTTVYNRLLEHDGIPWLLSTTNHVCMLLISLGLDYLRYLIILILHYRLTSMVPRIVILPSDRKSTYPQERKIEVRIVWILLSYLHMVM